MRNNKVHFIKERNFKKNIVKINFRRKTDAREITKLNLLLYILLTTSKKYKTNRELILRAKELYELSPEAFLNIYGNCTVLSFRFTFLKDKYTEENNSLKVIDFINEILFNPDVKNNKFNAKTFRLAKNQVMEDIKTSAENKASYSKKRMCECMDPASPYAIDVAGSLDDLETIDEKELYEFYLDIINNSSADVFALGDIDPKILDNIKFKIANSDKKVSYIYKSKERKVKTIIERDNLNQSKLVIGYNMNDLTPYEAEYALQIYLYILGLGPDSKLFTNVREKESLCYTISSTAKYAGSFMMISAGIDASTFDKTVGLIDEQIGAMQKGDFTNEEIESAKLSIKTSYRELLENPYTIINSFESSLYLGFDPIKKRLKEIDKIAKEDIIEVAKKIKLNTIYLLEGTKK
ncbi:MAG: insulinase family protein [Bacilli bacterium]|nr:insulinase family protein [Bacilli bacterium]